MWDRFLERSCLFGGVRAKGPLTHEIHLRYSVHPGDGVFY